MFQETGACGSCERACRSDAPRLVEISSCLKDMSEAPTFFVYSDDGDIKPRFSSEVSKVFHIGSWNLLRASAERELLSETIECYCAIAPHGQLHVAEVFFADSTGYRGTHRVFTLQYPDGAYSALYDEALMQDLGGKIFGIEK